MGLPGLGKLEVEIHELTEDMRTDLRAIRSSLERLLAIEEEKLALQRNEKRWSA